MNARLFLGWTSWSDTRRFVFQPWLKNALVNSHPLKSTPSTHVSKPCSLPRETTHSVLWRCRRRRDYEDLLLTAAKAGVLMVLYSHRWIRFFFERPHRYTRYWKDGLVVNNCGPFLAGHKTICAPTGDSSSLMIKQEARKVSEASSTEEMQPLHLQYRYFGNSSDLSLSRRI